ncbi:F-box/LRR-repeat protein 15-like [Hibiscus syriacus]|uniref:F-box/LRR-repeat protein 15-like n=1 Tax=Hibiscus syriacus TaxID=106335 RepID=UPI0019215FA9|nr:F-box/LRR-repeat protein 15-like [Hibiscus syriacus]
MNVAPWFLHCVRRFIVLSDDFLFLCRPELDSSAVTRYIFSQPFSGWLSCYYCSGSCLEKICLDGCDHLERASFCPASLLSLNLGICPKLNTLKIDAPCMVSLELKGRGVLSEASINCPLLTSLDASLCRIWTCHAIPCASLP